MNKKSYDKKEFYLLSEINRIDSMWYTPELATKQASLKYNLRKLREVGFEPNN